jgi:hypothetical protein
MFGLVGGAAKAQTSLGPSQQIVANALVADDTLLTPSRTGTG